jgi:hypothetical protein
MTALWHRLFDGGGVITPRGNSLILRASVLPLIF